MKTKLLLSSLLSFIFCLLSSQVPQGFNYQAIARDGTGAVIANQPLPVKITIQTLPSGGTVVWEEQHSSVTSNQFGLISLVVGTGSRLGGTAATFSAIDWNAQILYLKTTIQYPGTTWTIMGTTQLWSVPYSMVAKDVEGPITKLGIAGTTAILDEALFEVKNRDGQIIFAVYNEGVRAYVSDGKKGAKGGFAVGGFGMEKAESQKFFYVDADSIRAYVDTSTVKGAKGGFAVGGFGTVKGFTPLFMSMTPKNYFIGEGSGSRNTTGRYNSFLGFQSGFNNSTGGYNAFFGYQSGYKNDFGSSNLFLGYQSGYSNTTGTYNSFLGYKAGYANTTGTMNSFLGSYSGTGNISGSQNTFIGYWSGYLNSTGSYNNFIGYRAGYNNTDGTNNVFLGTDAGYSNTLGKYNIYLGYRSGYSSSGAAGNTFIGYKAGETTTNGSYNVFIGNQAGNANTASNNAFIGNESGMNNTTGTYNSFFGYQAGKSNTTGTSNVFMGNQAGEMNQTSADNVFIGYLSGQNHRKGANNVYIGSRAGIIDTAGANNVGIGWRSGEGNQTGESNVFISVLSGYKNTSGTSNVLVGDQAGINNTTGNQNVIIGREAGISNSTGSRNIMIGYQAGNSETRSDKLHIGQGSLIYGEMDNDLVRINGDFEVQSASTFKVFKSGNVGIGISSPTNLLHLKGNSSVPNPAVIIEPVEWNSVGDYGEVRFGDVNHYIRGEYTNGMIFYDANRFYFGGGSLGIGINNPSAKLDVNGNSFFRGPIGIGLVNTSSDVPVHMTSSSTLRTGLQLANSTVTPSYMVQIVGSEVTGRVGNFEIWCTNPNINLLTITSGGKVGIGKTNPDYKFDVSGDRIRLSDGTGDWIAMRTDGANDDFLDLSYGGGSLVIQGSATNENVIINPSINKVGIRTWTPQYELDVNGSIRAIGSVYYGGTTGSANGTAYTKPDYVFEKTYKRLSIEEVEDFLKNENHLPWVTSAVKEKEENGYVVDMTRMAFESVETIENLQLQIIEMNKQIRLLTDQLRNQQNEIKILKDKQK
jgi:hypothetical protein